MVITGKARSGNLFAEANSIRIHSVYDPVKEAKKYLQLYDFNKTSILLLLGPGIGYLLRELLFKYPKLHIVVFLYSDEFVEYYSRFNIPIWHPSSENNISAFLHKNVSEWVIDDLKILEWEPSAKAFPEIALSVNKEINQFVKESNGNMMSVARYGNRWLKNSIKNILKLEKYITVKSIGKPVIIAASGPSLRQCISFLKKYRECFFLLALPSSLFALYEEDLVPDLTISTDPGYYAGCHLQNLCRFSSPLIAAPLTSASVPCCGKTKTLLISQNTFIENSFLLEYKLPYLSCRQHGTVAGTALYLCVTLGFNTVIFAGLDLCTEDVYEHVQPHYFDLMFNSSADRFSPLLSKLIMRIDQYSPKSIPGTKKRISLPLETYAGWFSRFQPPKNITIYRLNPSPVPINSFINVTASQLKKHFCIGKSINSRTIDIKDYTFLSIDERRSAAMRVLSSWNDKIIQLKQKMTDRNVSEKIVFQDPLFELCYLLKLPEIKNIMKKIRQEKTLSSVNRESFVDIFTSISELLIDYSGRLHVFK